MPYSKVEISVVVSEESDYQPAKIRKKILGRSEGDQLAVTFGSAVTIDVSAWTAVDHMVVQNLDATSVLNVTTFTKAGPAAEHLIQPGQAAVITDHDPTAGNIVLENKNTGTTLQASYVLAGT